MLLLCVCTGTRVQYHEFPHHKLALTPLNTISNHSFDLVTPVEVEVEDPKFEYPSLELGTHLLLVATKSIKLRVVILQFQADGKGYKKVRT